MSSKIQIKFIHVEEFRQSRMVQMGENFTFLVGFVFVFVVGLLLGLVVTLLCLGLLVLALLWVHQNLNVLRLVDGPLLKSSVRNLARTPLCDALHTSLQRLSISCGSKT